MNHDDLKPRNTYPSTIQAFPANQQFTLLSLDYLNVGL